MSGAENLVDQVRAFFGILAGYAAKMPRDHKFTVGDRLISRGLDLLEKTVEAYYSPSPAKRDRIREANLHLEVIRQVLRFLFENGGHNLQKHEHLAREMDAIGKALGAWHKSLAARPHA